MKFTSKAIFLTAMCLALHACGERESLGCDDNCSGVNCKPTAGIVMDDDCNSTAGQQICVEFEKALEGEQIEAAILTLSYNSTTNEVRTIGNFDESNKPVEWEPCQDVSNAPSACSCDVSLPE